METTSKMRDLEPIEIKSILFYREKLTLINYIKLFIYILAMIFMFLERREIKNLEIKSPLLNVDQNLNKALFDNIINQSQFPGNEDLNIEYHNLLRESKIKSTYSGTGGGDFDRTDNNINNFTTTNNSIRDIHS